MGSAVQGRWFRLQRKSYSTGSTLGEPLALAAIRPVTHYVRENEPPLRRRGAFLWRGLSSASGVSVRLVLGASEWLEHTSACRSLREGQPSWLFAVEECDLDV